VLHSVKNNLKPNKTKQMKKEKKKVQQFCYLGWSFLTKDQFRIVTGPVSIPFIGRLVKLCAVEDQKTVMGLGRLTSP
jgi:hypothetical protein